MIACDTVHEPAVSFLLDIAQRHYFVLLPVIIPKTVVVHLDPEAVIMAQHIRKGVNII